MGPEMFAELSSPPEPWFWATLLGGAAVGALAAASMVVPAVRRWIYPAQPDSRRRDHILFDRVLKDGQTVRCTDGTLFVTIQVHGMDLLSRSAEEQNDLWNRRRVWLRKLGDLKVQMRTFSQRAMRARTWAADSASGSAQLAAVQEAWRANFTRVFQNTHYIVLSIRGGLSNGERALEDAVRETLNDLRDFGPEILRQGKPGQRSDLHTFWAGLLNPGFGLEVSVGGTSGSSADPLQGPLDVRLADHLIATEVLFRDGRDDSQADGVVQFRDGPEKTWMAGVGLSVWGEKSSATLMDAMLSLDAEMVVSQWVEVFDATRAEQRLIEKAKRAANTGRSAMQFEAARGLVGRRGGDGESLIYHQMVVFVFGETREVMESRIDLVRRTFSSFEKLAHRETAGVEPLYFSQFPPAWTIERGNYVMSANVADFLSFQTPAQGLFSCDWGPRPVALLKSAAGSPYGFTWHKSSHTLDVGHTLVIGGTGKGKTTLTVFLAVMSQGFDDARCFLFDRDDGAYVPVRSFGGDYLHMQTMASELGDDACQLNPLQMDLRDPARRSFVLEWIRDHVAQISEKDQESEEALSRILEDMSALPSEKRSLQEVYLNLPENIPVKAQLMRWASENGAYRHLFNGVRDTLRLDGSRLIGFDMTRTLEDPVKVQALLPYIAFRIRDEMKRSGCPWLLLFDEAAALLANAAFRNWYIRELQEARKSRGVVVSCFQRVGSLAEGGPTFAQAVLGQCPTMIIFPSETATEDDYMNTLGLNRTEFDIITGRDPSVQGMDRYVLIKREGEGSVVVDVDLKGPLGNLLHLFDSGSKPANLFRSLEQAHGRARAVEAYQAAVVRRVAA